MKRVALFVAAATCLAVAGCTSQDEGDVEGAQKAAAAAPKSVDQLPADMPPEARAAAASAMGQAAAAEQQANDPARVRAMQEMRRQSGQ